MKEFINALKPLFPVTYSLEKFVTLKFASNAELFTLLVKIAVYLVIGIVVSAVLAVAGILLPFLGLVWGLIGTLVWLYQVAGIVLAVLDYLKVFDKE